MRSRREAGPSDVEPDQIVVSCVFECGRHLGLEAILLYRSLDSSEGRLAKAKRRAYCVGALDPAVARPLEALSVDLVQTGPVLADTPLANKIRMFDCRPGEKVLVALDTDIVVVGELWPWVSDEVVGAKPVDQNPFSATHWRHIHRHLGLDEPSTRYRTHFDHELTPPYFNSGVIIMPGKWASDVAAIWTERTAILNRDLAAIDPGLEQYSYYTEQLAFALAVQELGLPTCALPLAMNFPTHQPVHRLNEADEINPVLLHHHHRFDGGGLRRTGYRRVDEAINRLNASGITTELARFFEAALSTVER